MSGVVRLDGGFMDGSIKGWLHDWPPPELLVAAKDKEGRTALVDPDRGEFAELLPQLARTTWLVRYIRTRCSYDHPLVAHYGYDGRYADAR